METSAYPPPGSYFGKARHQPLAHGYALLRVFFGGSRTPEMMDVDDISLLSTVRRELREIMSVNAEPLFHRIYRWHHSNPQYDVGHLDRVHAIEAALPENIFVSGSPYRGIGIPDCVHQGQETANKVAKLQSCKVAE